jgi:hypothetical protein
VLGPERGGECTLVLGPDEAGQWWRLGRFDDDALAARAADSLRRFLRALDDECEGMHVVEHLLLRPRSDSSVAAADDGIFGLRVTVVMPAWTLRTSDPGFRRLAEDAVRMQCPAHLSPAVHWLAFADMQRFEDDFGHWMDTLALYCRSQDETRPTGSETGAPAVSAAALDEAAARVLAHLRPRAAPAETAADDELRGG